MKRPDFQVAYREAKAEAVERAVNRLAYAAEFSVNCLLSVMSDATAPHTARVNAARSVMEFALQTSVIADLQRRITDLENHDVVILPHGANGNGHAEVN